MLNLALTFFDELLKSLFLDSAKEKIQDYLDRRNVERKISGASEAPAQALESFFRNEGLDINNVNLILHFVQKAISSTRVDAKMLASASLDAEKLTSIIMSKYPIPEGIVNEGLEWPYQMALRIAADTLCNIGPRFYEWEKEAWRRNFEAFDKLLQNQEEILKSVGPGGEGSLDERFEHTYRSHVLRRLSQIDASTFRVSSSLFLDLNTVFVQPDVEKLLPQHRKQKTKSGDKVISIEEARKQILFEKHDNDRNIFKADEFVSQNKRCAIVGLPGSGKTTLLQHILLVSAKGEIPFNFTNTIVPVFIKVRQLNLSIFPDADGLLQIAESRVFAGARPGFLSRQLQAGRVLFLIDGLDEIVDEKRDDLLSWIGDFIDLYPESRYVISSRPAGYQSNFFQEMKFNEASLCEFNPSQIREYVFRWAKAVEIASGTPVEEVEKVCSQYATLLVDRAEKNPYVRRIATNPLLLSTLCLVQRYEGGDLPNRRVILYQRCVEGLLFHWDNKRALPPALLGSLPLERKMLLLRRLAFEMQLNGVAEIEGGEIEKSFQKSLVEVGENIDPKLILSNIRDRSGLLMERRPWIYGFSHLTFQEYLAALSIINADYRSYDRLFLFSKRQDSQWAEVIILYAGLAPKDSVENLIEELLNSGVPNSISLGGECLTATQDININVQRKVIHALLNLPDHFDNTDTFIVERILESLDEHIVLPEAIEALKNLDTIHATRYMFFKKLPNSINPLLDTGIRILLGEQKIGKWDYGISLILLLNDCRDAALALRKIAEVALEIEDLGERVRVLTGAFSPELWDHNRVLGNERTLPCLLNFLMDPTAIEEQINLCKFYFIASEKVYHFLETKQGKRQRKGKLFSFPSLFFEPTPRLIKIFKDLSQNGDYSIRELASRVLMSLSNLDILVTKIKKEQKI